MEGCDVVWAIKDKSIASTFVDEGAAQFFLPHLASDKKEASATVKRQKYTIEQGDLLITHTIPWLISAICDSSLLLLPHTKITLP